VGFSPKFKSHRRKIADTALSFASGQCPSPLLKAAQIARKGLNTAYLPPKIKKLAELAL